MARQILADDHRHTTSREGIKRAIQQRTTRGMLTYNTGKVHRLEGELWAVPSTRGGFHRVDLGAEVCDCEDFAFYGSEHSVGCRHIYAAAIANATRRCGIAIRTISAAGDGFKAAAKRRASCAGCGGRFRHRDLYPVGENHLTFFEGDLVCEACAGDHGVLWTPVGIVALSEPWSGEGGVPVFDAGEFVRLLEESPAE